MKHIRLTTGLAATASFTFAASALGNGGDFPDMSVVITQAQVDAGYSDLADTAVGGLFNALDIDCQWGVNSDSIDVFYGFVPERDMNIHVETCGANFDTLIYIVDEFLVPQTGDGCNDDYPGCLMSTGDPYASIIECFPLLAGVEYHIAVDGTGWPYGEPQSGQCTIVIREATPEECGAPCEITCPTGAISEAEPCGLELNDGCNMAVPAFEAIAFDQVVCGTGWFDLNLRDTDWYQIVLTETAQLSIEGEAEFRAVFGLAEYTTGLEGSGNCADLTGQLLGMAIQPCTPSTYISPCLPPGTYWVLAAVDFGTPGDPNQTATVCGTLDDYWVKVTTTPASCVVGACCFEATGHCIVLTEADCIGTGTGTFMGDQTDCEDLDQSGTADICEGPACPEDLDGLNGVGQGDLNAVLNRWGDPACEPGGASHPCPEDLDVLNGVGQGDLNAVLNRWGDPACE